MLVPTVRQLWRIDTASFQKFTRYYTFIGEPSRERYSLGWGGLDRPDADRTVSPPDSDGLRNTTGNAEGTRYRDNADKICSGLRAHAQTPAPRPRAATPSRREASSVSV